MKGISQLIFAFLLLALLAACAGQSTSAPAATQTNPEPAASTEIETATAEAEPTDAPEASAPATEAPAADPTAEPAEAAEPDNADSAAAPAFPVTLTHSLGTVEIPAPPQRVVALGPNDIDTAVALGYAPVATIADWSVDSGISPWLEGKIDPAQTKILPALSDLPFEEIAALQPDLILGGSLYNIGDLYPTLSQIAPTTAWLNESSFTDPWQEQTRLAARALGQENQAEQLIATAESQIAAVKADYPELAGKTFTLSYLHSPNEIASLYSQEDFAVQFFQQLGFVLTPEMTDLAAKEGNFQAALSLEGLPLLEADLVVLAFGSPEIRAGYEANPLFQNLKAVQEGRYIVVDLTTVTQLRGPTVLGIPWVLDQLRPGLDKLVAASASTPATGPVTIQHEKGELTFATPPQKVVVLEYSYVIYGANRAASCRCIWS